MNFLRSAYQFYCHVVKEKGIVKEISLPQTPRFHQQAKCPFQSYFLERRRCRLTVPEIKGNAAPPRDKRLAPSDSSIARGIPPAWDNPNPARPARHHFARLADRFYRPRSCPTIQMGANNHPRVPTQESGVRVPSPFSLSSRQYHRVRSVSPRSGLPENNAALTPVRKPDRSTRPFGNDSGTKQAAFHPAKPGRTLIAFQKRGAQLRQRDDIVFAAATR